MVEFHDRRDDSMFNSNSKCDNCGSRGMVVERGSKSLCVDCANSTRQVSDDERADRRTLGYEDWIDTFDQGVTKAFKEKGWKPPYKM